MPVGSKARVSQRDHGALGETAILETAAGQHHRRLADGDRGGDNDVGERVVRAARDDGGGDAALHVGHDRADHRRPVDDQRRRLPGTQCESGAGPGDVEGIDGGAVGRGRKFKIHRRLSLEAGALSKARE